MTTMGLIYDYGGLLKVRWFLETTEAGLFPGVNYFLSCWYKRSEFGIRAAIFFSAAALAGSFGGLLAAAIATMDGVGGKPGWAWIFILEGLATILIAFASFWMVSSVKPHKDQSDASYRFTTFQMRQLSSQMTTDAACSAASNSTTNLVWSTRSSSWSICGQS